MEPIRKILTEPSQAENAEGQLQPIELIDNLEINEKFKETILKPYLGMVYESLLVRTHTFGYGIPSYAFSEFLGLPGLISERLFTLFDLDNDKYLNKTEFIGGTSRLFNNSFNENVRLIFCMLDFDNDGVATREDFRTLLSHVPMAEILGHMKLPVRQEGQYTKSGGGLYRPSFFITQNRGIYLDRLQCQEELARLLDNCMKETAVTLAGFQKMTEEVCSTIYLCLFLLLRKNSPIYGHFSAYLSEYKSKSGEDIGVSPAGTKKLLATPKTPDRPKLSPLGYLQKLLPYNRTTSPQFKVTSSGWQKPVYERASSGRALPINIAKSLCKEEKKYPSKIPHLKTSSKAFLVNTITETDPCTASLVEADSVRVVADYSTKPSEKEHLEEAKAIKADKSKKLVLCACGKPCEAPNENTYKISCDECKEASTTSGKYSGYLYEMDKCAASLKRNWFAIVGRYLHRYQDKKGPLQKMYSLVGSFVRDDFQEFLNSKQVLYPLSLIFGETKLKLYAIKQEEKRNWLNALREVLNYSSLIEFYDIRELLGQGKFGCVRAAISKQKGKRVAIKFINKVVLTSEEIELIRREIEVLKLCQHPNIIMLYDVFENTEYIYIVMELLRGGDLTGFLKKHEYKINERRACGIIHSIATALFYLHSYGIIHRDIKPENIVMVDESEDSDIKIVDFGLSKLVGPTEKCLEPYGTYGYAAPEVLRSVPYTKNVDVWSLGVVAFILLWGIAPFQGKDEEEVAYKTICEEPDYTPPVGAKISKKALDCVKRMLMKNPSRRITLKELLVHPWIGKHFPNVQKIRTEAKAENEFRMFTLSNPTSVKIYDEVKKRSEEICKPDSL